jgi:glycosyltransferase involved in cell wall biosynthesis
MKDLAIYFRERGNYRSSVYYRQILPCTIMKELKYPVKVHWDRALADVPAEHRLMVMGSADIYMDYQDGALLPFMQMLGKMEPYKGPDGEMLFPPTTIADTDDDIFNVHPLNNAFGNIGYKRHDGTLCEPNDEIWIKEAATGEPQRLWAGGVDIDYARNRQLCDNWRATMKLAPLVTCTTEGCADYVRRELGQDAKIHIYPNCINFPEYYNVELAPSNEVRILWQGSGAHWDDLWTIHKALAKVHEKYPKAKWVFWGDIPSWLHKYLPGECVEVYPFIEYIAYKLRLQTMNHDINLCPLNNTEFSRAKSAIKFYESSAITKPAATLASNMPVYGEIIEGETGLLYNDEDEFVTKLGALIEDATLRTTLAANAKDWVRTNLDPRKHVPLLYEKFIEVREAREKILGPLDTSEQTKKTIRKAKAISKKPKPTNKKRKA